MTTTDIKKIIGAHNIWKLRFELATRSHTIDTPVAILSADDQCPFGKWLAKEMLCLSELVRTDYEVVKKLHAKFHEVAGEIASLIGEGKNAEADALLANEFNSASKKLVSTLEACDVGTLEDDTHPFHLDIAQACIPIRQEHRLRLA